MSGEYDQEQFPEHAFKKRVVLAPALLSSVLLPFLKKPPSPRWAQLSAQRSPFLSSFRKSLGQKSLDQPWQGEQPYTSP